MRRVNPHYRFYRHTEVLITALQWAQRWYPSPDGLAVELTHTACGGAFTAVLTCDQCARPLHGAQIAGV